MPVAKRGDFIKIIIPSPGGTGTGGPRPGSTGGTGGPSPGSTGGTGGGPPGATGGTPGGTGLTGGTTPGGTGATGGGGKPGGKPPKGGKPGAGDPPEIGGSAGGDFEMPTGEGYDEERAKQIDAWAGSICDRIVNADNPLKSCGSHSHGKEAAGDELLSDYEQGTAWKRAKEIIEEAVKKAPKDNPIVMSAGYGGDIEEGSTTGSKKRQVITYVVPPTPEPPDWVDHVMGLLGRKFTKKKMRGGFDVRESFISPTVIGGGAMTMYKGKPKMPKRKYFVYVLADVSGSMTSGCNAEGGNCFLSWMMQFVPMLAERFDGEVWWCSNGLLKTDIEGAKEAGVDLEHLRVEGDTKNDEIIVARTPLKFFKDAGSVQISQIIYKDVAFFSGYGGGGGHDIAYVEFAKYQQMMMEEHNTEVACIALTDFQQSDEYLYPKNMIVVTSPATARMLNETDNFKSFSKFKNDPDNNIHVVGCDEATAKQFKMTEAADPWRQDRSSGWGGTPGK